MARETTKTNKIEENLEEAFSESSAEDLQAQVEQLKEDIAAIAATLANLGSQTVRDAGRTAKHTYRSAYMQGEDVVDDLKSKAQDVEAQLCATVRERPIASLVTALGVGYLLALLSRR
ncbi:DNA gyrase subunit B [Falsochrobactrum sp. TDYN1]|uniref:DNA gyrase subunit B n=1 Tax=Falsochrobactrum tianjinense TaxID=2706015 RepID=A0A949UU16_9HYPH|nr:DNA gyrase subunit B [Falsochrobactrum sp. TDYN1]MBV2144689.1 DNA gyrase subunit B [Falsochrobactrum sp. TDYN1]